MTGVGDDPFICICGDGFGGDTCNLTETGTPKRKEKERTLWFGLTRWSSLLLLLSQDRAVLTPVRMTVCVKLSRQPDGAMSSTSTSASASRASRECTARSVGHLQM